MAGESPPCRAAPRPLAVLLGCLAAACAPAVGSPFSAQATLARSPFIPANGRGEGTAALNGNGMQYSFFV